MRVGLHEGLDLGRDGFTLVKQGQQLFCELRQHNPGGAGAEDHDALFPKGCEDGIGETFGGAGRMFSSVGL